MKKKEEVEQKREDNTIDIKLPKKTINPRKILRLAMDNMMIMNKSAMSVGYADGLTRFALVCGYEIGDVFMLAKGKDHGVCFRKPAT